MKPDLTKIVCATRGRKEEFRRTPLGQSLGLYPWPNVEVRLFSENKRGLPAVYNEAIAECRGISCNLVFVHDDVYLCDFFWPKRIRIGLKQFDVLGLAGNKRRVPKQPSWAFPNLDFKWDSPKYLSGVVGHGDGFPPNELSFYGEPGQEVRLLDGLMLAANSNVLHSTNLRFDEKFDFHFYDLDFCREAESKELRMGTWPISVVHRSGGNFESKNWRIGYQKYLAKWGD